MLAVIQFPLSRFPALGPEDRGSFTQRWVILEISDELTCVVQDDHLRWHVSDHVHHVATAAAAALYMYTCEPHDLLRSFLNKCPALCAERSCRTNAFLAILAFKANKKSDR